MSALLFKIAFSLMAVGLAGFIAFAPFRAKDPNINKADYLTGTCIISCAIGLIFLLIASALSVWGM